MQVTMGRKGDYSVRAIISVARHGGTRRKTREIAEAMDIPPRYLTQILAGLVRHGLLDATAGPSGGYVLARPAEQISLLEVVEAAEGPIVLDQCVLNGGPCSWTDVCPIHIPWARSQNALVAELADTSIAQLVTNDAEITAGAHVLPPEAPLHGIPVERRCPDPD